METSELVRRAQHGDQEAFAGLVVAMGNRLHALAQRILRDADLAEDASQQALLAIWRDLPGLREPDRFEAWAYRVVIRCCYAEGRRQRQWAPNLHALPYDLAGGSDPAMSVWDRDQLERAFRRLSIEHRAAVVLRHYLDLEIEQMAPILGVPVGTVRSRLHYGMRALRASLEADSRLPVEEAR